ncbi:hypothetical protein COU58_00765 [Candidatus Pacearchaeota archaeon CG10_big_fil_rev_8_21_14_0_10_32_42]|nr:MAG: hypothetical protein COU58_00765 [Candidatus Pacearchaeota archaeon CG10_big_fil_rev_8_21_14_0_10_32_42]
MANKNSKNKKIRGFSIRFMPYSEIKFLNSTERIKKILDIVFQNYILILQGKLKAEEETRLIGDTMAMIGHVKDFKGIELSVISSDERQGTIDRLKNRLVMSLSGGDLGAVTIIGPASIVKEIKRDPKKIELLLNK